MTDLDQLLHDAFEARAALPSGGIAPTTVAHDVRRRRARTAVGSALATVAVVATAAVVVSQQQGGGKAGPAGSPTSAPPSWQPGKTIASLPFGKGLTVSLRYGDGTTDRSAFDFCVQAANPEYSCNSEHVSDPQQIDREGDSSSFFGLAPANTAKVVVTVRGEQPVTAALAKLDLAQPGVPAFDDPDALMFAAPGVTAYLDPTGSLTKASTVEAFDGAGKRLAILSTRGTSDLAQSHPPVGSPFPSPGVTDQWFWTSADGWTCSGRAATLDGRRQYGADQCWAPSSTDTQMLNETAASTTNGSPKEYFFVRVPKSAASAHLTTHDGQTVDATILHSGPGSLIVLEIDSSRPVDPIVLTLRDANGTILSSGDINQLPAVPSKDIVSGT